VNSTFNHVACNQSLFARSRSLCVFITEVVLPDAVICLFGSKSRFDVACSIQAPVHSRIHDLLPSRLMSLLPFFARHCQSEIVRVYLPDLLVRVKVSGMGADTQIWLDAAIFPCSPRPPFSCSPTPQTFLSPWG
jgi:hypothetical protein